MMLTNCFYIYCWYDILTPQKSFHHCYGVNLHSTKFKITITDGTKITKIFWNSSFSGWETLIKCNIWLILDNRHWGIYNNPIRVRFKGVLASPGTVESTITDGTIFVPSVMIFNFQKNAFLSSKNLKYALKRKFPVGVPYKTLNWTRTFFGLWNVII